MENRKTNRQGQINMGILSEIFSGASSGAFEGVGSLAKDLRTAITGEIPPEKKAELEQKILEIESAAKVGQLKINEAEARSGSVFVAGWRPSIGWVCSLALLYQFILHPLLMWANLAFNWGIINPPVLNMDGLFPLVMGMLGMGGLRSFEKAKGMK
jgi:hypothetical protein